LFLSLEEINLHSLHKQALAFFERKTQSLPEKRERLRKLNERPCQSIVEKKRLLKLTQELTEEIAQIERGLDCAQYQSKVAPLLERYQELTKHKSKRVFGARSKENPEEEEEKRGIVLSYLFSAQPYLPNKIVLKRELVERCPNCYIPLKGENCPQCPEVFIPDFDYSSYDSKGYSTRQNSNKSDHIRDAFIKFQGKQPNKLPPSLILEIEKTVREYKIPFDQLTINTVYQILHDKKYSAYYDDVYLLYHLLTGKALPNLEEIEPELFRDADDFARIYPEVKPENRSNCLTGHFIRDVLLRRRGYYYPEWQCSYIRTDQVDLEHNLTMAKAFEKLEWGEYVPL